MPENFDYIIIGAGSAGCILANRLSESGKYSICLIEAGPSDYNPFIHIPAGFIKRLYTIQKLTGCIKLSLVIGPLIGQ